MLLSYMDGGLEKPYALPEIRELLSLYGGQPRGIHAALWFGELDKVLALLATGEDANRVGPGDRAPLLIALDDERENTGDVLAEVELLIENGALVNVEDSWFNTPLLSAVRGIYYREVQSTLLVVQRLLENGAIVNVTAFSGDTPLMIAVRGACESGIDTLPIVDLLLKSKALPNYGDPHRPMDICMNSKFPDLARGVEEILRLHGGKPSQKCRKTGS